MNPYLTQKKHAKCNDFKIGTAEKNERAAARPKSPATASTSTIPSATSARPPTDARYSRSPPPPLLARPPTLAIPLRHLGYWKTSPGRTDSLGCSPVRITTPNHVIPALMIRPTQVSYTLCSSSTARDAGLGRRTRVWGCGRSGIPGRARVAGGRGSVEDRSWVIGDRGEEVATRKSFLRLLLRPLRRRRPTWL